MSKINWKTKLTSRKFWAAVAGFVTTVITVFRIDSLTVEQATAMVSAIGLLIAYIIGEGLVDSAKSSTSESGGSAAVRSTVQEGSTAGGSADTVQTGGNSKKGSGGTAQKSNSALEGSCDFPQDSGSLVSGGSSDGNN